LKSAIACALLATTGLAIGSAEGGSYPTPNSPSRLHACTRKLLEKQRSLSGQNFLRDARGHEITIDVETWERARNTAQTLPAMETLKFHLPPMAAPHMATAPNGTGWSPLVGRLGKSALYGKVTGWKYKAPDGRIFLYRIDWDPIKGAHVNVSITAPEIAGGFESTWKAALTFKCGGKPCTADDVVRLATVSFSKTR